MIELFLVRHGEAAQAWGQHEDPELSSLGCEQARQAAVAVDAAAPKELVLVSSPKVRAQQTAEPLAELRSAPVVVQPAFREVPSMTDLATRQAWLQNLMRSHWSEINDAAVLEWRAQILSNVAAIGHHTAVFTHFMVLNVIVGHIRGCDKVLQFWPDNASVTRCRVIDSELVLVSLGAQMDTQIN
jgi:Fructose-2,6-bisphosphatase